MAHTVRQVSLLRSISYHDGRVTEGKMAQSLLIEVAAGRMTAGRALELVQCSSDKQVELFQEMSKEFWQIEEERDVKRKSKKK